MKKFFISIFFFLLLFFTSNCNFKRFEQKKFFCEKNKLDIELIDILETRSIKKSYITIKGKEHRDGCKNIILPLDLEKQTKEKVVTAEISAPTENKNLEVPKQESKKSAQEWGRASNDPRNKG